MEDQPTDPEFWDESERSSEEWDAAIADAPDAVGRVIELADLDAIMTAQRLQAVASMCAEARADAGRYGVALGDVVDRSIRLELAAALRITEHAATELMSFAEAVVHEFPTVHTSLACAGMTARHAEILVREVVVVEAEFRDKIVRDAIALAEALPVGSFRRGLRKLIETVRSATLAERHEQALQGRRAVVDPAHDGLAWLHILGPAVEVQAAFGRATAMAKILAAQEGEHRTLDQLRADVLFDLLIDGRSESHPPEARGIRATVAVTLPALSLLDGDRCGGGAEPPVVEGIGPIPLERARELCGGEERWMRILTHPETGMVLSVGRDRYRPPPALRKLVRWRADRCMAPGCHMPATRCQIDHNVAWEDGGHTCLGNLCPFCQGHHTVKHHGGWIVRQIEGSGGAIEWISPTGRRYVVVPERSVPVFRSSPEPEMSAPF